MSSQKQIDFRIDSRLEYVALVGVSIRALCQDHGMDEMHAYQVQTAVTEAINNAILHAYANQPGHAVDIRWSSDGQTLTIKVCDQGTAMAALPPAIEPDPEAENGRGWWIMRQWMDSAAYHCDGARHCVILSKSIHPQP
jgi:serine/threonine-protein kinase RsbW